MRPLLPLALLALAASSHAILLDDFTTGGFDSSYLNTTSYTNTTAASVPGGSRYVGYTRTANPLGEDYRVRINSGASLLMFTTGIGSKAPGPYATEMPAR